MINDYNIKTKDRSKNAWFYKLLFAGLCLMFLSPLLANTTQNKRITGIVVDAGGEALVGVNLSVEGTALGTVTDIDGKFAIENVSSRTTLVVSYIGYVTQKIAVGNLSVFNITLLEDTQKLDEVVVVGYGSFKKRDLTGAVTQVKGDEVAHLPLRSAADALQGKAAGVTITATSGSPGSMGTVRVRGVGTLNDNKPLYVVDGLPQTDIGWLNARDIESIEVLKDASAQAIYGARAANGVILISTKHGESGDTYRSTVEFDMNVGFQSVPKRYDMLDAEGFMEYKNRAYAAAGRPLMDDFATSERREQILAFLEKNGGRQGTDWWKEITRKPADASLQTYNLAFSGGMNKLRYRASFGYMDQQGILISSDYQRLSGRLNLDSEVNKWLDLSANIAVIYEGRRNLDENNAYMATVFTSATADPITPVYRNNLADIPDFLHARLMGGYEPTNPWSQYAGVIYSNKTNPVAQAMRSGLNQWWGIVTKSNISGLIKLLPGDLKFVDLNRDGRLDDEDRTMIGNPHPDFTFGLTFGAEYKGFDFSAFFQGSAGNNNLYIMKYDIYSGTGWYNAPKTFWTHS